MKKQRIKKLFLEELRKIPIVAVACKKVDISRQTVYRWNKEDLRFSKMMDEAITDGEATFCDLAESKLYTKINEGHWQSLHYFLDRKHPKYKENVLLEKKTTREEIFQQAYAERDAKKLMEKLDEEMKWEDMSSSTRKIMLEMKKKEEEEENKRIEDIK